MQGKVTDWVAHYQLEYPHVVCVPAPYVIRDAHDWLETHVGERDHEWQYPIGSTYMFRDAHDAIQFALAFT